MKVLKFIIALVLIIVLSSFIYSVDKTTWSYAGSMKILTQNGTVEINETELVFRDYNHELTSKELNALSTLSDEYKIWYK